jgi:hypothetical protein
VWFSTDLQDSDWALFKALIGLPLAESLGQAAQARSCLTGKPAGMVTLPFPSPQTNPP